MLHAAPGGELMFKSSGDQAGPGIYHSGSKNAARSINLVCVELRPGGDGHVMKMLVKNVGLLVLERQRQ